MTSATASASSQRRRPRHGTGKARVRRIMRPTPGAHAPWSSIAPSISFVLPRSCRDPVSRNAPDGCAGAAAARGRVRVIVCRRKLVESAASRRAMLRAAGSLVSLFTLAGCAGLASTGTRFDASGLATDPTLLVATTRKAANPTLSKPWFGPERATAMSVARLRLTPPSDSRLSLAAAVGLDDWRIDRLERVAKVGDLFAPAAGARDVLIYVHGFNQTFETAALDAARLSDGIRFRGETMAFAWPSRAKLFDYGYDRESAMWSRDALQQVFAGLMASPGVARIHVVAHSVGTMLTMEALRQIYARQGQAATDRIGAVIFASPDIDMDGFTSSVERIGPLAARITVMTA